MICKRCLRPYVRQSTINISFSFRETKIDWEGCVDCGYQLQRQLVDFLLKATEPTHKAKRFLEGRRISL